MLVGVQRRLRLALLFIVGIFFFGAAGFRIIEDWPWFDGLYMTLITMTTVGYSEVQELS